MTAAIVTALRVERAALAGRATVPVLRAGMGPAAVARRAPQLAEHPGLLSAGVAGGLSDVVRPGDLVVAEEILDTDGRRYPVASAAVLAGALRRHGLRVHVGPVAAADRVVSGPARTALARTGALAVDMESAALARLADGRPFAAVRAVVDTTDLPLHRPGTPARGLRALRALRRAAPVLSAWAAAVGERRVLLAAPRSFCAGVDRAVDIVTRALERYGPPLYVRRQIVHNTHVVADLQARGVTFVTEVEEVPRGGRVVLAAHGVSPAVRADAEARDLAVIDATCPLVTKVHAEVRRYAAAGRTVLLIGHADHEEVEGTVGEAPGGILVVPDAAAAAAVEPADPTRLAYVTQTTLAVDEADDVAGVLTERFPGIAAPRTDDICYATTNRQAAVREIARSCRLVLVVGSANSSNSRRLVEVAAREGASARLVEDPAALDPGWLVGVERLGVTAGASAPEHLVDDLVGCLRGLGPVEVSERRVTAETVQFTLPKEVS